MIAIADLVRRLGRRRSVRGRRRRRSRPAARRGHARRHAEARRRGRSGRRRSSIPIATPCRCACKLAEPRRHAAPERVRADPVLRSDTVGPLAVPADGDASRRREDLRLRHARRRGSKRQDVVAGSINASMVPIRDGLEAGDQVVVRGAILLDNQIQLDDRKPTPNSHDRRAAQRLAANAADRLHRRDHGRDRSATTRSRT